MYVLYVNTGRPAIKYHDASQIYFQIIQNLAQVTKFSSHYSDLS